MNDVASQNFEGFPPEIWEQLGFYVYRLIDPRNGETFYIGKGWGNRVFQHAIEGLPNDVEDDETPSILPPKNERIKAIKASKLRVLYIIHRHGISDAKTAYHIEAALIDAYPGLTNRQGGHGSDTFGPMHPEEILFAYNLPEIPQDDTKLLLININKLNDRSSEDEIYRLVRYCWRLSKVRAEKADYVLAVVRGVVIGAFVADEWKNGTFKNFGHEISYADDGDSHRFGFFGKKANKDVWEKYVGDRGKKLPKENRHSQNPIKYVNY
jgi:uncharacterized protein